MLLVDPACRGGDCLPVNSVCADGRPRNSDGNCPTPTTTTCPAATVPVNGMCCNVRDDNAGRWRRLPGSGRGIRTGSGCGGQPPIVQEIIAKRIIDIAAAGERDPDELARRALQVLSLGGSKP